MPTAAPQLQVPSDDQLDDLGTLRMLEGLPRIELLPPRELPTRWIDYSCFDLAFISRADLEGLAAKSAARLAGPPRLGRQRADFVCLRYGTVGRAARGIRGPVRDGWLGQSGARRSLTRPLADREPKPDFRGHPGPAAPPRNELPWSKRKRRRRSLHRLRLPRRESPSHSWFARSIEAASWPCRPASRWRHRRPKPLGCSMNWAATPGCGTSGTACRCTGRTTTIGTGLSPASAARRSVPF